MMEKVPAAIYPDATVEELRRRLSSRLFEIFKARSAHGVEVRTKGLVRSSVGCRDAGMQ